MKDRNKVILAWFLFILSEILAGMVMFSLNKLNEHKHVIIMGGSMIVLNGHAMVMFRLLPCVHTYILKYWHALIETGIIAGGFYGSYLMHEDNKKDLHVHAFLGMFVLGLAGLQWLVSLIVYATLFANQRRRKHFSAYHNFVGVVIHQLSIVASSIQLTKSKEGNDNGDMAVFTMVGYGIFVNTIVLNPHLEWRLVGPM